MLPLPRCGPKFSPRIVTASPPTVSASDAPGPSREVITGAAYAVALACPGDAWPPTTMLQTWSLPVPGAVAQRTCRCATSTAQSTAVYTYWALA